MNIPCLEDAHASEARTRTGGPHDLPADVYAMLLYGLEEEMVVKPADFFIRRTGALLFDIQWVNRWKQQVIDAMALLLNYSEAQVRDYTEELELELERAVTPENEPAATG